MNALEIQKKNIPFHKTPVFCWGIPIECHAHPHPWNLHVQRQGIQPLRIGPRRRRRHHHALDANAPRAARRQRIVAGQEGHGAAGGVVAWWVAVANGDAPKKPWDLLQFFGVVKNGKIKKLFQLQIIKLSKVYPELDA